MVQDYLGAALPSLQMIDLCGGGGGQRRTYIYMHMYRSKAAKRYYTYICTYTYYTYVHMSVHVHDIVAGSIQKSAVCRKQLESQKGFLGLSTHVRMFRAKVLGLRAQG